MALESGPRVPLYVKEYAKWSWMSIFQYRKPQNAARYITINSLLTIIKITITGNTKRIVGPGSVYLINYILMILAKRSQSTSAKAVPM